jgi:hypothetical protein
MSTYATEFVLGTTIVLQSVYYNTLNVPIDADESPPVTVEIRDSKANLVQTGLIALRESPGTYRAKYRTNGLKVGTYYFVFVAYFSGDPDRKSSKFVLKAVV